VVIVGHQYAKKMKEAEIESSQRLAASAQTTQNRQNQAQLALARLNARVGQADLLSKFISELFHPDPKHREVAIKAILIAIPDEGVSIVSIVAQQTPTASSDPQIQAIARSALDERRSSLVEGLVSKVVHVQIPFV